VDGPPYPVALRLYAIAESRWPEIEAHYLPTNILKLSPATFCNAVYAWCVLHMDPEQREKWDLLLEAPLPGMEARPTDRQIEDEGAAFMALLATDPQGRGPADAGRTGPG